MKKAIIFLNGDLSDLKQAKKYIKSTDLIICADAGAEPALKLNLIPDVIIGDFDSLTKEAQNKIAKYQIKHVRFDKEKNETDSELALDYAVKQGCKEIYIFGILGSRLDHVLSNIFHLENLAGKEVNAKIIEGDQEIRVIRKNTKIKGQIGDLVSLIPLKGNVKNISTKGLQYKLDNEDLLFGYSRGISNVFTDSTAEISIKSGSLLVIHTKS